MFNNLIGQSHIKQSLEFYIAGAKKGGAMPPLLLTGGKGIGKTAFARQIAKELKKAFLEINCSTIPDTEGGVTSFFEQVFVPVVMGNEVTILFDEAHKLPNKLQQAFLTVFNTEKTTKTSLEWRGSTMEFDFTKQTFIFATTEQDKLFHAFKDRLEEIDFRPYSLNELAAILKLSSDFVEYSEEALHLIVGSLRGTPRATVKRAKQIRLYCELHNKPKFGVEDWKKLCKTLGIHPQGLTNSEIEILKVLRDRGACTLTMLAAATGLAKTAIQKDIETFLLRKGFMRIEGTRQITGSGVNAISEN